MTMPSLFKKLLYSRQFRYDNGKFFMMMDVPGIIIAMNVWVGVYKELLSNAKGKKKLFEIGHEQGLTAGRRYSMRAATSFPSFLNFTKGVVEITGIGQIKFASSGDNVIANISPSPIAENYRKKFGKTKEPICHYVVGISSGAFEGFTKKKWEGKEVKCVAKGDSFCQIIMKKK